MDNKNSFFSSFRKLILALAMISRATSVWAGGGSGGVTGGADFYIRLSELLPTSLEITATLEWPEQLEAERIGTKRWFGIFPGPLYAQELMAKLRFTRQGFTSDRTSLGITCELIGVSDDVQVQLRRLGCGTLTSAIRDLRSNGHLARGVSIRINGQPASLENLHELHTRLGQVLLNQVDFQNQDSIRALATFNAYLRGLTIQTIGLVPRLGENDHNAPSGYSRIEEHYLLGVHQVLMNELLGTNWASYSTLPIRLEQWTPEWFQILGRAAPAAVQLDSGRIVLDAVQFNPEELRFFLFHELAHLADPQARLPHTDEFSSRNELYAWEETFAFMLHRERQGKTVPARFIRIRENATLLGLENWVQSVIRSRSRAQ